MFRDMRDLGGAYL